MPSNREKQIVDGQEHPSVRKDSVRAGPADVETPAGRDRRYGPGTSGRRVKGTTSAEGSRRPTMATSDTETGHAGIAQSSSWTARCKPRLDGPPEWWIRHIRLVHLRVCSVIHRC
jgi:hypothetical protein